MESPVSSPIITICILTWNRYKFLDICLENLFKSLYYAKEAEIIVMDNGSTDNTADVLKKHEGKNGLRIIRKKKHTGLNAYKKLFKEAKGKYVVDLDDDVLEFPKHFDKSMVEYMEVYRDYGFLALNVIQNEFTNGAKPGAEAYMNDKRGEMIVQHGPTGGWCTCFRRADYGKIKLRFSLITLSFKRGEDGALSGLFKSRLGLKSGIIKSEVCLHASGAYYAKKFGHLDREIEKYRKSNLTSFVKDYESFRNKE